MAAATRPTSPILNGEADIGALPMTGVLTLSEKFKVLGVFNRTKNNFADLSENAPLINKVFGTDIPDLYSARAWAVHTEWADKNPKLFEIAGADLEGGARVADLQGGLQEDRRADRTPCSTATARPAPNTRWRRSNWRKRYASVLTAKRGGGKEKNEAGACAPRRERLHASARTA